MITCANGLVDLQSEIHLRLRSKIIRIRALRSENKDLRDEFRAYTNTDENSDRVGEFAIGTNIACTHIIGHILQDEKIPGVHIAFGHPYAEHTGRKLGFQNAHRLRRPGFRHLVQRPTGDARREVFDIIAIDSHVRGVFKGLSSFRSGSRSAASIRFPEITQ